MAGSYPGLKVQDTEAVGANSADFGSAPGVAAGGTEADQPSMSNSPATGGTIAGPVWAANGNQPPETPSPAPQSPPSQSGSTATAESDRGSVPAVAPLDYAALSSAVSGVIADDDRASRATLISAANDNPDHAAKIAALGRRYDLPNDVVDRNYDQLDRQAQVDDAYAYLTGAPDLKLQFANANFAACAIDDVPTLASINATIRNWGELKAWQAPAPTFMNKLGDLAATLPNTLDMAIAAYQSQSAWFHDELGKLGLPDGEFDIYGNPLPKGTGRDLADAAIRRTAYASRLSEPDFDTSTPIGWAEARAHHVLKSLISSAPFLVLGPEAPVAVNELQGYGQEYAAVRARGGSIDQAHTAGLLSGGAQAIFSATPLRFIAKSFGKTGVADFTVNLLRRQIPNDIANTITQKLIDMSVANPQATAATFLAELPSDMRDTVSESLLNAGLVSAGHAVLGGREAATPGLRQAAATVDAVARLNALAGRSKLAGRDPSAFQRSVQQMADTHGVGTVHIASGKLMQALTAPGVDAAGVLRRMPATMTQLRGLPAQGGDLAIPTGELIAGISGSGAEETILPHLRPVPEALSLDQLRAVVAGDKAPIGDTPTTVSPGEQIETNAMPQETSRDEAGAAGTTVLKSAESESDKQSKNFEHFTTAAGILVNANRAIIDIRKLTDYALHPGHPIGQHKAKIFASVLGFDRSTAQGLSTQIANGLSEYPARVGKIDQSGTRFTVDIPVIGPKGRGIVRTGWIYRPGSTEPALTTLFVK